MVLNLVQYTEKLVDGSVHLGRTELGDIVIAFARRDHRKSKFGPRHCIQAKLILALCNDEVRILIFDDPAEQDQERSHRPIMGE